MGLKEKFLKFMLTEHVIKIGWLQKIFLTGAFMLLLIFLPVIFLASEAQQFEVDIQKVCDYAMLEPCDKLESAYPYCHNAQNAFRLKNCTFVGNKTGVERFLMSYR